MHVYKLMKSKKDVNQRLIRLLELQQKTKRQSTFDNDQELLTRLYGQRSALDKRFHLNREEQLAESVHESFDEVRVNNRKTLFDNDQLHELTSLGSIEEDATSLPKSIRPIRSKKRLQSGK